MNQHSVSGVGIDRRVRRSEYRTRAAMLYLEAVASRGGPRALVLSDRAGVMVGAGDEHVDLDVLDQMGRSARAARAAIGPISVDSFTVDGRRYRITAAGRLETRERLREDLSRILRMAC